MLAGLFVELAEAAISVVPVLEAVLVVARLVSRPRSRETPPQGERLQIWLVLRGSHFLCGPGPQVGRRPRPEYEQGPPLQDLHRKRKSSEVCISPGGRFPPFSSEGKPPRKVAKGPRDLTLCRVFREKTCCDVAQTYPALLSIRRLASAGEASQECLDLWEVLECSICNPLVGIRPGPPVICASLCDMIFHSCSDAYFSIDVKTQVLSPCGLNDVVCGRASEWVSNGTDLCQLAGFSVQPVRFTHHDAEEPFCYGTKATLDSAAKLWRGSQYGSDQKAESSSVLGDFQLLIRGMTIRERSYWAVGGTVLTAGLIFVCKRESLKHRQKQAAIRRTARMLRSKNTAANCNN
ncbi:hypothetical protein Taro_025431 [Colocasia esculenta]|uniref:Folate receptor-like domain-containing protein n=1 Tax=Colocasia esculenta TaxID=4460 RepID=A0A843V3A9_COLES|nr:hypothetical protein [Colocasia esculenta]